MSGLDELVALIKDAGLKPCFWFGRPPCPLCEGDHGDRNATEEYDRECRVIADGVLVGWLKDHNARVRFHSNKTVTVFLNGRSRRRKTLREAIRAHVKEGG